MDDNRQEIEQLKQAVEQLKKETTKKSPYKVILIVVICTIVIALLIPVLILLYSYVIPDKYTVTFSSTSDLNRDGLVTQDETLTFTYKIKEGDLVSPPDIGETYFIVGKTIWKFAGWRIDNDTPWKSSTPITTHTTIYAKWTKMTIGGDL